MITQKNTREKIKHDFVKLNPHVCNADLSWRLDGRLEWTCERGVGHTVWCPHDYIHGCDGCCKEVKTLEIKE